MITDKQIEKVKTGIRCESLLTKSKGNLYCCAFCGSGTKKDKSGAVKVYPDNGWYCHACKKSGDSITLIMELQNLGFKDAVQYGLDLLGSGRDLTGGFKASEVKRPVNADFSHYYEFCNGRLAYKEAISYLSKRGISYETANKLSVGYDPQSDPVNAPGAYGEIMHPVKRLIFPTKKNHYVARRIDGTSEYAKLNNKGGSPGIFNQNALTESDVVFVSEGVFDALSYEEIGYHSIAINSTSNVDKLLSTVKETGSSALFVISFDNDTNEDTAKRTREAEKALSDG